MFFFFFWVSKVGLPLMGYTAVQYTDCYSEPMSIRLLNSIFSGIRRQNTQFIMYSTTSKQQEGCMFKDSHPKCFITTNFDKFPREAVAKGVNRGDVLTACFRDIQSQRSIMYRSIRNFNIPPPPGRRREFELFKIWFFKFPVTWTKNVFKFPTVIQKIT